MHSLVDASTAGRTDPTRPAAAAHAEPGGERRHRAALRAARPAAPILVDGFRATTTRAAPSPSRSRARRLTARGSRRRPRRQSTTTSVTGTKAAAEGAVRDPLPDLASDVRRRPGRGQPPEPPITDAGTGLRATLAAGSQTRSMSRGVPGARWCPGPLSCAATTPRGHCSEQRPSSSPPSGRSSARGCSMALTSSSCALPSDGRRRVTTAGGCGWGSCRRSGGT